jgi:hypothetical protein
MPIIRWDPFMYWTVAEGGAAFDTAMPAFRGKLSRDDRWAAIAYIQARLPRVPGEHAPSLVTIDRKVAHDPADVSDGNMLSDVDSCATCHPDAAAQWSTSAHSFASFGNPLYRARRPFAEFLDFAIDRGVPVCINGDGVDIMQSTPARLTRDFAECASRFSEFARRGLRVHYVVGNHDIALEHFLAEYKGTVVAGNGRSRGARPLRGVDRLGTTSRPRLAALGRRRAAVRAA